MFKRFLKTFPLTAISNAKAAPQVSSLRFLGKARGANEFISRYGGCTFSDGLYRVHPPEMIKEWTFILEKTFPEFQGTIECFSYDWLGRQFALDVNQCVNDELGVLMFDVGSGEVLKIPVSFHDFHDCEIVDYHNEVLNLELFTQWMNYSNDGIPPDKCASYKLPIFLNGEYTVENLKLISLNVHWHILGQLLSQVRQLAPATKVDGLRISGEAG